MLKKQKIYPAYVLKHTSNSEKQVILLMILGEEGWNYFAIKEIIKKNNVTCCLNCLHSFATEKKCKSHKKLCEKKDFCNVLIPFEDTKFLNLINTQSLIKHHLLFSEILNVY